MLFLVIELVTPPLDGTILEGVTRQSILDLARRDVNLASKKLNKFNFKFFSIFLNFILIKREN